MNRTLLGALLSTFMATAVFVPGPARAADKKEKAASAKEVTLKGTMACAKCALHESDTCQNVLKVTDGGKEVKYYVAENEVAKKNHGKICGGTSPATVKGKVSDDGGKKVITASEIKYE